MRSFAIAALVGTVTAAPATIFAPGDAPKCYIGANGQTVVEYTDGIHPSFKCSHTGSVCSCTLVHPTHHDGACQEFDHNNGKNFKFSGDCTDSGKNHVDGGWSGWTYGTCSKSCGTGTQSMTRSCTNPAPFHNDFVNGAECTADGSSASSSQDCNTHACPVDGAWSDWTYGTCSTSCGAGTKSGTRTCDGRDLGGADCAGSATGSFDCDHGPCPVHCTTSAFDDWSACTAACGTGTQSRSRTITTTAEHGGYVCPYLAETQDCNTQSCAVNGGWSGWGGCTSTGTKTRTCTNPAPAHGGAQCSGASAQSFDSCFHWKRVSASMVGASSTDAMHVTVTDSGGSAHIHAAANGERSPGCGQVSATTFIDGPWTKIKYTENMHGSASCYSIFGSRGYASGSASSNTVFVSKSNTHDMGPYGLHQRCDNQSINFWHGASGGAAGARGSVVMHRSDMNAAAGVQTGVACFGSPSWNYYDMHVWLPKDTPSTPKWKRVTASMVSHHSTDAMQVSVGYSGGGATISASANGARSPGCGSLSATTFIRGSWTKIKYTETMHGSASCYSIFGSRGYAAGSTSSNTVFESKWNQRDMGPYGRHQRCDNQSVNFWHGSSGGAAGAKASVVMRRVDMNVAAGVQTGVACFGSPSWTYSDIWVLE